MSVRLTFCAIFIALLFLCGSIPVLNVSAEQKIIDNKNDIIGKKNESFSLDNIQIISISADIGKKVTLLNGEIRFYNITENEKIEFLIKIKNNQKSEKSDVPISLILDDGSFKDTRFISMASFDEKEITYIINKISKGMHKLELKIHDNKMEKKISIGEYQLYVKEIDFNNKIVTQLEIGFTDALYINSYDFSRISPSISQIYRARHKFNSSYDWIRISDTNGNMKNQINELLGNPQIKWINYEENDVEPQIFTPDDPYYTGVYEGDLFKNQWAPQLISANSAWDYTLGNKGIIVAVIDTGIEEDHEDLQQSLWTNYDEVPNDEIDNDNNGYVDDVHGWNFVTDDNNIDDTTQL